jgi:hypothetical protein
MDLSKALEQLYAEKEKLEQSIAILEGLMEPRPVAPAENGKRRGRLHMGPDERKEVSVRMRAYWASRRNSVSS